jgi:CheY-like chemotaxis protein
MTNAIKFTAPSDKRVITVIVAASLSPPDDTDIPGFQYVPTHSSNTPAPTADDNNGETIYIRFRVQDTGCGLTPEEKQRLFQRFKQASPRTHAQYGGSGLGLFISKRLAELHGGQIGVASEAGVGSLFGFFVQARRTRAPSGSRPNSRGASPVKRVSDVSAPTEIMPQRTESLAPPPSTSGAIQPVTTPLPTISTTSADSAHRSVDPRSLHILIVEDNLINQRVLRAALQKAGCTVHVANDGLEALSFLSTTEFTTPTTGIPLSVILMDLEMPNMDGLTCVKEIRKMEDDQSIDKHVPVIAVTANVRDEQVASARESGMDDVVSKPFRIQELLTKIESLLKKD